MFRNLVRVGLHAPFGRPRGRLQQVEQVSLSVVFLSISCWCMPFCLCVFMSVCSSIVQTIALDLCKGMCKRICVNIEGGAYICQCSFSIMIKQNRDQVTLSSFEKHATKLNQAHIGFFRYVYMNTKLPNFS